MSQAAAPNIPVIEVPATLEVMGRTPRHAPAEKAALIAHIKQLEKRGRECL